MYFIQGIGEPTEGLIAQPVKKLLTEWELGAAGVTRFMALLAVPWMIKPLYGLLTDFVPLFGTRRRSYLLITSLASAAGLLALYWWPIARGQTTLLFALLIVPTVGVAFGDVVVDALMVEKGQPLGLTGRLQSIQWAALYSATVLNGVIGGYLSDGNRTGLAFLICGAMMQVTAVVTWLHVDEPPAKKPDGQAWRRAVGDVWGALRHPALWLVGGFLFLWNFNPFTSSMMYVYMTTELKLSDQFYGYTVSIEALAAIAASVSYGFYCRRVPFGALVHLSILCGVISTVAHCWMRGETSAILVSIVVGFTYMTATLVQLDLAARACPANSAGTMFAMLMALSNVSTSLATATGGQIYEIARDRWDAWTAFNVLVAIGAVTSASCWALVPWLRKLHAAGEATSPSPDPSHPYK
jgi:Na+/melibiose symporter-like transporter